MKTPGQMIIIDAKILHLLQGNGLEIVPSAKIKRTGRGFSQLPLLASDQAHGRIGYHSTSA